MFGVNPVQAAGVMLTPPAVGLLSFDQPLRRTLQRSVSALRTGNPQRRHGEPHCIREIDSPAAWPRGVGTLPSTQHRTPFIDRLVDLAAQPVWMLFSKMAKRGNG